MDLQRGTSDTVISHVQASVLSRLRTGDPVLDAVLTTVLVSLLAYLSSFAGQLWESFKDFLRKSNANAISNSQSLTVDAWCKEEDRLNAVYNEFIWYISKIDKPNRGDLKVYRRLADTGVMTHPVDDQKCKLVWNEHIYTYYFWTRTKDQNVTEGLHIEIKSDSVEPLLNLITHIRTTHQNYEKALKWEQKFCSPDLRSGVHYWGSKLSRNKKTMETIVLQGDQKQVIQTDLERFLASEEWYQKLGLPWNRGYLLCGPPGTGKTSLIKALSFSYELDIYYLSLSEISSDETLKSLFAQLPVKCMLVLEDVDCMTDILHRRDVKAAVQQGENDKAQNSSADVKATVKTMFNTLTLSNVLNLLDGVVSSHGRILIMTSNHPEKLDPALLRPGRCDMTVTLGNCSICQMEQFYRIYFDRDPEPHTFEGIPEGLLTPAQVSGVFLAKRYNPEEAITELRMIVSAYEDMCHQES